RGGLSSAASAGVPAKKRHSFLRYVYARTSALYAAASMPTLRHYTVVPRLPPALERLRDIAHNLWWSWTPEVRELFVRVDADLFEEVHGNPIELLSRVDQARLDELAADDAFLSHLESGWAAFQRYMSREGWFHKRFPDVQGARIAYFSMEYGLNESLPI